MKAILKNLITLKSRWIPNNPIETFTPYIIHLIRDKKLYSTQIEEIAREFEKFYEFSITSFLIKNVLAYLVKKGICKKDIFTYRFEISKLKPLDTINEAEQQEFVNNVNDLILDFIKYCGKPEIEYNDAEQVIIDFVKEYDSDLLFTENGLINRGDNPAHKFFWIEYLMEKMKSNNGEYRTVLKMCEGNIIKSLMFDEVDSNNIYPDTKIFVDTPIVFRLLGYYGMYLQTEYEFLFESWKNQGGSFFIYEHNLEECVSILRTAEEWVESKEIDLSKTSDVCTYFRSKDYAKEDVAMELESLEKNLKKLGIKKYNVDFNEDNSFMEDSHQIREMILKQYNKTATFDATDHTSKMVDIDAKSILYSFYLRKDNNIHSMREAKLIYLTSNSGIYIIANNYQKSKYGQSISPVQLDSFMGMVICLNDSRNIAKITENRIISHCYSAYKPSKALKESYNQKLIDMLTKDEISNEDYYLLKHHSIVTEQLVKGTCGVAANLNDETIYDFLNEVKIRLVEEERELTRKQLKLNQNRSIQEKELLKNKYEESIKEKDEQHNRIIAEKKRKFDDKVNFDFNLFISRIKKIYYAILISITILLVYFAIKNLVKGNISIGYFISGSIMIVFTFGQILFYSIKISKLFSKIFYYKMKYYQDRYKDILI